MPHTHTDTGRRTLTPEKWNGMKIKAGEPKSPKPYEDAETADAPAKPKKPMALRRMRPGSGILHGENDLLTATC